MQFLDPLSDSAQWDRLVSNYSNATVFHSAAWAKVLNRTYGQKPLYLSFQNEEGDSQALIPIMELRSPITGRRAVSLPFSDLCPLLLNGAGDPTLIRDQLAVIASERRWKYLELRGDSLTFTPSPDLRPLTSAPSPPSSSPTFLGHILDLTIGTDALLGACSSSVRRALRKAERSQLIVRIEHTADAMREFFRLHSRTRRRHGVPPQSYRFFQNIGEELISKKSGFIVSAYREGEGRPIAAAVFLRFGDSAIYKFGASDQSEWNLRPNNLVMWEGIKHLAEAGAEHLHFGRTTPGQKGLRRFKLSWGTREEPINYIQYDTRKESWKSVSPETGQSRVSKIAHKVISKAPLSLNRLAGSLIYPHLD